jgi:hypothetical protein
MEIPYCHVDSFTDVDIGIGGTIVTAPGGGLFGDFVCGADEIRFGKVGRAL